MPENIGHIWGVACDVFAVFYLNQETVKNFYKIMLAIWILSAGIGGSQTAWAKSSTFKEYQVKAAFLYYFGKFVEWPETAFGGANSSFVMCILGEDPFGKELETVIQGKLIQKRPILIRRIQKTSEVEACHLLFISSSEQKNISEALSVTEGAGVLAVGETPRFIEQGGAIQFLLRDNKVRFAINMTRTTQAGLKMSSQLLKLAIIQKE